MQTKRRLVIIALVLLSAPAAHACQPSWSCYSWNPYYAQRADNLIGNLGGCNQACQTDAQNACEATQECPGSGCSTCIQNFTQPCQQNCNSSCEADMISLFDELCFYW